jgi:1,4-dihydroxy-6-naphthoate synthase
MKPLIKIGISPCPNDTYIFGALYNEKIESHFQYEWIFADVEELNYLAFKGEIDVVKMSYFAYSAVSDKYQILRAGGALGKNCGPLLIAKDPNIKVDQHSKIAIPGINTTANLLLHLAYPKAQDRTSMIFSSIEKSVSEGLYDLGLIIHESRFTYQSHGLYLVCDLGEYWEQKTGLPLPLGAIAVNRSIPNEWKSAINNEIRCSIQYARENEEETLEFAKLYAQEMDQKVMKSHIDLYVNEYSLDIGEKGKQSAKELFKIINKKYPERSVKSVIYI